MTSKERFTRMFEHREADRIPIIDSPWAGTIARWKREGMPEDADWRDYFDVDKSELIYVDTSPRFEQKVLEETDRYRIITSPWGVTMKEFKEEDSTPEFLDFKVVTPEEWEKAKARMTLDRDRIDWKRLETEYPRWVAEGRWIEGYMWSASMSPTPGWWERNPADRHARAARVGGRPCSTPTLTAALP